MGQIEEDNRSLLELMEEVSHLPHYMQADAIKNLAAAWSLKSPLVHDVVNGHTSFEKAIGALVQENANLRYLSYRRGVCNSPRFVAVAEDTKGQFGKILPLSAYRFVPRGGPLTYTLTDSVRSPLRWAEPAFNFGAMFFIVALIFAILFALAGGTLTYKETHILAYWPWGFAFGFGFGAFLTLGRLLFGYPSYLANRRSLADTTLKRAQYLDRMLKPNAYA